METGQHSTYTKLRRWTATKHQVPTMTSGSSREDDRTTRYRPAEARKVIMLTLDNDASSDINTPVPRLRLVHHPTCAETYMKSLTIERWAIAQYLEWRQGGFIQVGDWCLGYAVSTECVLRYSREHLGCGVLVCVRCMRVRVVSFHAAGVHISYFWTR